MAKKGETESRKMVQKKDEIVITGVSCRLPQSDNMQEFEKNLMNKIDMITEDDSRWPPGYFGLPKRHGKLKNLSKFDASFFSINPKQANCMDPQLRLLLEVAHEAILDAGINPKTLRGTNTGVFVGCSSSEMQDFFTSDPETVQGYSLTGCQHSMFANRLSFTFDLKGPSFAVDTACSSSLMAFQLAVDSIKNGTCEAALVCGVQLTMKPTSAMQFFKLGMLSPQGKCQAFDAEADGYVRSEGIVAVLLQKESSAHRIYAEIMNAKSNTDGFKEQGITYPNGNQQAQLLRAVYSEARIDPEDVIYVECHGTGTKVGDPQEGNAITEVLCKNRKSPLLIGSVKSNMGHAEPASGLAALCKVLIAANSGYIAPNLHYTNPNPNISGLINNQLQVVTEKVLIEQGIIGINSFGFGGANTHVILKIPNVNDKKPRQQIAIPEMLLYCGRTEEAVIGVFDYFTMHGFSNELYALLSESNNESSTAYPYRGYLIYDRKDNSAPISDVQKISSNDKCPVWYIYSGMGTHYPGMGKELQNIDAFRETIKECSTVLEPFGINVYDLIFNGGSEGNWCAVCICAIQKTELALTRLRDLSTTIILFFIANIGKLSYVSNFENCAEDIKYDPGRVPVQRENYERPKKLKISHSACVVRIGDTWKIALTETLKFLGISPDGIVGHSFGEMAAGYADNCMTLSQTMLCAYYRTKCILEGKFEPGGMAAVGMSWEEALEKCPEGVIPACHNAKDSVTISGAKEKVAEFVAHLQSEGVFAKEVNSAGIAFHSKCIQTVSKPMKQYLEKILPHPKQRSAKWISSSVPMANWQTTLGSFCSADYHVNNAVSPVIFYEALKNIPSNAVLIEISPHCLLQAIIRRCLPSCTSIGLLKLKHANNLEFFMENLGRLYTSGLTVEMKKLYPTVRYPVSRKTPMISPLVHWDHSQDWFTATFKDFKMESRGNSQSSNTFVIDPYNVDSQDKYLLDHVIGGRILYPFAGHVYLVWKTLCKLKGFDMKSTPVILENISVHRATMLPQEPIKLNISISIASGLFEIIDNDQVACSGKISIPDKPLNITAVRSISDNTGFTLSNSEVYKILRLRGYDYGPHFRPISKISNDGLLSEILWYNNWVSFIDAMLQAILLSESGESMKLPVRIRYLAIDPVKHMECLEINKGIQYLKSTVNPLQNQCISGGIMIRNLVAQSAVRRSVNSGKLVLEKVHFVKYNDDQCLSDNPTLLNKSIQYQNTCQKLILELCQKISTSQCTLPFKQILAKLSNSHALSNESTNSDIILDKNFNSTECQLASLLVKLKELDYNSQDGVKLMSQLLKDQAKSLPQDFLQISVYNDIVAKPLLDVVMENTAGCHIRACMLEPASYLPAQMCKALQLNQPLLEPDWCLISANDDNLFNEEQLKEHSLSFQKFDIETISIVQDQFNLILLDNVLHKKVNVKDYLEKVKKLLKPNGFMLISEVTTCFEIAMVQLLLQDKLPKTQQNGLRKYGLFYEHESWMKIFQDSGYNVVSYRSNKLMHTLYLLRSKCDPMINKREIVNIDDVINFSWVDQLKKAVDNLDDNKRLWLTANKGMDNGLIGLGLCLKSEIPNNSIKTIVHLDNENSSSMDTNTMFNHDLHSNVYKNGSWGSFRHLPVQEGETVMEVETDHAFVNALTAGDLSSLAWIQSGNVFWKEIVKNENESKQLCYVHFAALNFRDIMLASGRLSEDAIPGDFANRDCLLGMEFSGLCAKSNQRVMGLTAAQAMATSVIADKRFVWHVPDNWSLEEAATVPVVYTTAYYALVVRGRIKPNDKVLIHGGSGGVGQAAISVALANKCEVFTSTSSDEKVEFLLTKFPALSRDHITTSRSADFEDHIMQMTNGRGVDVVLNSLSEDKLQASVRCLAEHGRFLEIGKFDLSNNSNLGMSIFLKNVTFHGILLDSLFGENNHEWPLVSQLFENGIKSGTVVPLNTTLFSSDHVVEAFRYMAQGRHIGKVLLKIQDEKSPRATIKAVARTLFDPSGCYVITGGLGGFGLELTKWMIKRGAKKIILTSRTGLKSGYQNLCYETWIRKGVDVRISNADVTCQDGACVLIGEAQSLGPLLGVFHLAMVLQDGMLENQTQETFKQSSAIKYMGAKHLDEVTRKLCGPELKYFVVFSSISCGRGNPGQTNYGWSNSAMERIVETRNCQGYPALAIQWGAIGDVGVVIDGMGGDNSTVIGGTCPQRIASCMQILDTVLSWNHGVVSSFVKSEIKSFSNKSSLTQNGSSGSVTQCIAQIMGVTDLAKFDHNAQFGDLGLDSLMGVEIKQVLERRFSINLSSKEIRTMTMNKLTSFVKKT